MQYWKNLIRKNIFFKDEALIKCSSYTKWEKIKLYEENIEAVGELIQEVEVDDARGL